MNLTNWTNLFNYKSFIGLLYSVWYKIINLVKFKCIFDTKYTNTIIDDTDLIKIKIWLAFKWGPVVSQKSYFSNYYIPHFSISFNKPPRMVSE